MEEYIRLQQRNDELWDLLEDPDLPSLDRLMFNEEMLRNTIRIVMFEDGEEDTLSCASSQSLEPDEYDREGWIVYAGFDFAGEI